MYISFKKFIIEDTQCYLISMQLVLRSIIIRKGICIPLDVKPDLVRNITTRNGGCGQCA